MLGFGEMLLILVVVVLIFGSSKLSQLGDALGKSLRVFKRGSGVDENAPLDLRKPDKS